jgi:hypothetical protein
MVLPRLLFTSSIVLCIHTKFHGKRLHNFKYSMHSLWDWDLKRYMLVKTRL